MRGEVTEASLNGFASNVIPERICEEPYRFLICSDKFQTGYDEPLLHTMYVDKPLSGIKAVQTLSRLNRAHLKKHDTFVLDFQNDVDTVQASFQSYYRTTILSKETDPNRLHDLKADLDQHQVYSEDQVDRLVDLYLSGADRTRLDPIFETCVDTYIDTLDEDKQVHFKGTAKAFVRAYGFLSSILPFNNAEWEKLSILLNFLIPKLPAPQEDDLSKGILESIDMDSYRAEVLATMDIVLADEDAQIDPVPTSSAGGRPEPEMDWLSNIIRELNERFGNVDWQDVDRIRRVISELPDMVATNVAYQKAMKNSDRQNAWIEHEKALQGVVVSMRVDQSELVRQFMDNPDFRRWLTECSFERTYRAGA